MSKRIVLARNSGNSGGAWLMRVWSMHKEVLMLTEAAHYMKLTYAPKKICPEIEIDFQKIVGQHVLGYNFEIPTKYDVCRGFLLDQFYKRKEEVFGLIKCFNKKTIDKCKEICNSVKVVQTLRNPVGTIDFHTYSKIKIADKNKDLGKERGTEEEIFKQTVKNTYRGFLFVEENMGKELLIKLEDLNISLRDNTSYFKDVAQDLFEVEYDDNLIKKIIEVEGFGDDGSGSKKIWENWPEWKKTFFMDSFESLMKKLNYFWIIQ